MAEPSLSVFFKFDGKIDVEFQCNILFVRMAINFIRYRNRFVSDLCACPHTTLSLTSRRVYDPFSILRIPKYHYGPTACAVVRFRIFRIQKCRRTGVRVFSPLHFFYHRSETASGFGRTTRDLCWSKRGTRTPRERGLNFPVGFYPEPGVVGRARTLLGRLAHT